MEFLTKQQESFCENGGLFGVMISITCLIQMMIVMNPHWIPFTIIGIYILCITAFVLLMKKSIHALRLLFISSILVFLMEGFMLLSNTFSLVLLILLIYLIVIVALLYSGTIPQQIKKKNIAVMEEEQQWSNIL